MTRNRSVFLLLCLVTAALPFFSLSNEEERDVESFPGWPRTFEGRTFQPFQPSEPYWEWFARDFRGEVGYFTDGTRQIVLRWMAWPPTPFHAARDCFQRSDYRLNPGILIWRDAQGSRWRMFEGERANGNVRVYERIYDDAGQSWLDMSSLYWAVLFRQTDGPWRIMTIIEPFQSAS